MELKTKKFIHLGTYEIEKAKKLIRDFIDIYELVCVLENPNLETNIFDMWPVMQMDIMKFKRGALPIQSKKIGGNYIPSVQSTFSRALKQAQSVGKNQAAAQEIIKFLDKEEVFNLSIKPSDRQKALTKRGGKETRKDPRILKMPTKTNASQFTLLTGYKGRSNEHSRDAATLVFGMTIPKLNYLFQYQNQT